MRIIFIACGAILLAGLVAFIWFRSGTDHHGNPFKGFPSVAVRDLADKPNDYLKKDARIEGAIDRQCPASGCWFFVKDTNGKEVKVEMGDTTPKLPQRLGKTAVVEGQLIKFGDGYEFIGTAVEFRK